MTSSIFWLSVFFCFAFLSAALVGFLIRIGGVALDRPNARSSHSVATPRGGGLPVTLCVVIASVLPVFKPAYGGSDGSVAEWVLGGALLTLLLLGAWDDRIGLSARLRFGVQLACSIIFVGSIWDQLVLLPAFASMGVLSLACLFACAVLWLCWSTNLFNFMDGINGIAAGCGMLFAMTSAFILFGLGLQSLALIYTAAGGALLGFLPFNFPRAKIFLGDAGSIPLGFLFGAAPLFVLTVDPQFSPILTPIFLGPFFVDATWTLLRRAMRGAKVWQAHREHLYQRLADRLKSHSKSTLIFVGLAALMMTTLVAGNATDSDGWLMTMTPTMLAVLAYASLWIWLSRSAGRS